MDMRLRSCFLAAGLILATAAVAGCTGAQVVTSPVVDLAAVRAVDSAYATAWLSNDPEQVIALFTEDAVISPSGMPSIEGRDAMRAFWWPSDAPTAVVTRFDLTQKWADGSGEVAAVRGSFELSFDYDGSSYSSTGDYNTILVRGEDGSWRIHFRAWNDLSRDES